MACYVLEILTANVCLFAGIGGGHSESAQLARDLDRPPGDPGRPGPDPVLNYPPLAPGQRPEGQRGEVDHRGYRRQSAC